MFMARLVPLIGLLTVGLWLAGCGPKKPSGSEELGEAGYPATTEGWIAAAAGNDPAAMKKFLAEGFDPLTRDVAGDTALHAAAAAGAREAADLLLGRGVPVDQRGGNERTPLMSAVLAGQTAMVRWLLRQGADPKARDGDRFTPLMLAVRVEAVGPLAELASADRESLDDALLLAAVLGSAPAIDTLTQYGASVYARMDDGRTALMVAAENGHLEAATLLLELGTSRLAIDANGRTAADFAAGAGHPEIVAVIQRELQPDDLVLDSPDTVASEMVQVLDESISNPTDPTDPSDSADLATAPAETSGTPWNRPVPGRGTAPLPAVPLQGRTLGTPSAEPATNPTPTSLPLVMRQYRQRELPVEVRSVEAETATLRINGSPIRDVSVRAGQTIPGSNLVVVSLQKRMQDLKDSAAGPVEVSVVELRDAATGTRRELISGVPATAHDPIALVEDSITGQRYLATTGQRFRAADGTEFLVSDVRPNQLIIEDTTNGTVQTIPLRGPRG
jgi:ankyrin repeat protein